jgi:hypothetical protein
MALRSLIDSKGRGWRVWDVTPRSGYHDEADTLTPGLGGGWVCFEHGEEKRRLSPIPEGWEVADAETLERYLERATPVAKRAIV